MFACFQTQFEGFDPSAFYQKGIDYYETYKQDAHKCLESYIIGDALSAEAIEADWFPSINVNVFISHSHRDERFAISFAGWLYEHFGIESFIDSCMWGYANDFLQQIDKRYCVLNRKPDGAVKTYDYAKRNQSTAHVHMILNSALHKMIDKTECLIFLKTPNSISLNASITEGETYSPWIYSELLFASQVCHRQLQDHRSFLQHDSTQYAELNVKYQVKTDHLYMLTDTDMLEFYQNGHNTIKEPTESLDWLYEYKGMIHRG